MSSRPGSLPAAASQARRRGCSYRPCSPNCSYRSTDGHDDSLRVGFTGGLESNLDSHEANRMIYHLIGPRTFGNVPVKAVRSARRIAVTAEPDLGRLVRALRERLGLTQEKFAARLGVTFPTINRWENGRARPSPLAVKQIEDLLAEMGNDAADLLETYFPQHAKE